MSEIVISGANGYLGSYLVKHLAEKSKTVFAVVRRDACLGMLKGVGCRYYYTDQLDALFQDNRIDVVIHTATCYGRNGETDQDVLQANLLFPLGILNRFVVSRGGETKKFINIDTVLPRDSNAYALSKKQFQDWLKFYAKAENKMATKNVLLNYMYGPHDDKSKFTSFVIDQCRQDKNQIIPLSSGEQKKDFIYVDDVVSAICLLCDATCQQSYTDIELGSGKACSVKDYAQLVHKILDSKTRLAFGLKPRRVGERDMLAANISQLQKLGWSPKYDLESGLKKAILTEQEEG